MLTIWQGQGEHEQGEHEHEYESELARIYDVTEGLPSPHSKRVYLYTFNHFIKTTVKDDNVRTLLNTKQSVVESKIIDHMNYLKNIQHLSYSSIQIHLSGILHFFSINDYHRFPEGVFPLLTIHRERVSEF